jgi:hypothetical protein
MSASITSALLLIYERLLNVFSYEELEDREMETDNRLETVQYSNGIENLSELGDREMETDNRLETVQYSNGIENLSELEDREMETDNRLETVQYSSGIENLSSSRGVGGCFGSLWIRVK